MRDLENPDGRLETTEKRETMNRAHHWKTRRIRWPALRRALNAMGFCCLLAAFFCPAAVPSEASDEAETFRVLVLQSYHKGFSWTDDLQGGIESVLEGSGEDIEIAVEYMDAKRQPVRLIFDELADLYAFKYDRWRPDLIISCDDDALDFLFVYRDRIFPGVPVVFCGLDVESYDPSILKGRQGYTGVVERLDLAGTIDVILEVQPAVERIVVIHDWTTSGRGHRKTIEKLAPRYGDRVDFIYPNSGVGLTEAELLSFLSGLDARAAIYFLGFSRDRLDKPLPLDHIIPLISRASPVPVYTHVDAYFGYGTLGGKLLSAGIHGQSTAAKALRLLKGASVSQMPVSVESSNRYVFDYRQLRRFSIPESRLPGGSVVAFAPTSFLDRHLAAVVWGAVGILALVGFTIALLANILRRRRVEKELRASEALFKAVYDAMPLYLALWRLKDDDFILSDVNVASVELSGASIGEWFGTTLSAFYEDSPWFIDAIGSAHSERKIVEMERMMRLRTTSKEVCLNLKFVPVPPDRVMAVAEDVTERKKAEANLKIYQRIVSSTPDAIAYLDNEYRYRIVNDAYEIFSATKRDEFLGKTVAEYLGEETFREKIKPNFDRCLSGETIHYQDWFNYPTLGRRFVSVTYFPFRDEKGKVTGLVASTRDITDLKESDEKFRVIVDHSGDGIALVGRDPIRLLFVNQSMSEIFGYSTEELLSMTMEELVGMFHPDHREIATERIKDRFKGKPVPSRFESRIVPKNGDSRWIELYADRVEVGGKGTILTGCRDITDRKQAETQLQAYSAHLEEMVADRTRELEKAQEELLVRERLAVLGHFAGSISHELRNPLGAVDSSIFYLKMKLGTGDEKIAEHLARVRTNIDRATAIIESLLNLSRMEKPKTRPHAVTRLMPDILRAAKIPEAVRVETIFPEDEVAVEVDADQIRMAVKNILHNAVQAMEGAGILTVDVRPPAEGRVEIRISDTGPGIPPENTERIFQPLFSTKVHGIGFGLSIAKMIVERHGGKVLAESPADGGARFVITLPQAIPPGG
jgi:PAS domain S-box-containing protein